MPQYQYVAVNGEGKRISGTTESSTETTLRATLGRQGYRPISIKKVGGKSSAFSILSKTSGKVKAKDLVVFTRQLATMINAGVPLVRSLNTMMSQTENPAFKKIIGELVKDVEGGMSFADALEKHPAAFGPIFINMVRAGEAGGILDDILKKLAVQQEKDAAIRAKFKGAMTYPAVLIGITMVVFIVLMVFVVPKISKIVGDLGTGEMPKLTQAMLAISSFITDFWFIHIGVLVGTTIFLKRYLKTPGGRRKRDKLLLKIPAIRTVVIKMAVARFSRIFASLMSAGVSVIESINITAKAIGNSVFEDELNEAAKAVANGAQFSDPLSKSKNFPPIVGQMLAIGEETGQTDTVLLKVADFYEEEVDAAVEGMSSILEPLLIVVMGTMVGLIAASVIGPISNLSNQI